MFKTNAKTAHTEKKRIPKNNNKKVIIKNNIFI